MYLQRIIQCEKIQVLNPTVICMILTIQYTGKAKAVATLKDAWLQELGKRKDEEPEHTGFLGQ